jgi:WD40 repeat protein
MPAAPGDQQVPRPQEVFISYSRKDKEFVRRLDEALRGRGREAWVDWQDIRPTEDFMQAIYGAIEGADTFISVLTPDSVVSYNCGLEIAHAAANNKRMVPVVARDVKADTVPEALRKLNWIFYRDDDDFEKATDELISAFDTDLNWVHSHTRLLTRAIEWDANGRNNSFVLRGEDLRSAERWLAQAGAQKERQPTALQTEYIIASRKAAARRQRITLGAVTFALVVAIALAVVAFFAEAKAKDQTKKTSEAASRGNVSLARYSIEGERNAQALAQLAQALRLNPENREASGLTTAMLRQPSWPASLIAFMRHDAEVVSAQFSPDGQRLVTASRTAVQIWDAVSGKPMGGPIGNGAGFAQFSPDGQRVIVNGVVARVWDIASGKPIGEPMKHDDGIVNSAQFSPDGLRAVTASNDKTARLWDAASGKPIGEPMQHKDQVWSAQFSPDGLRVVTASFDGTARVWDATSGKPVGEPMQHKDQVWSAQFSPDGLRVVTASLDGTARVWDATTGKPVGEPMKHENVVSSAAFSPDGQRVVTASGDNTARLWDAFSGQNLGAPMKHEGLVGAAQFSPDGQRVVTASLDRSARVWDATSGKPIGEPMKHEDLVYSAQFSPDGQRVVTASFDGTARVWHATSGQPLGEPMKHEREVVGAFFTLDRNRVVTISEDSTARLWDAASGAPLGEPMKHSGTVIVRSFSPDGQRMITVSEDNTAQVWDTASGKPLGEPMKHEDKVSIVRFSPDGHRVVTASKDKTGTEMAWLWDAASGKPLGEPIKYESEWRVLRFSPDGQRVVSKSEEKTVQLWDAASGKPIGESMKHEGEVSSAQFSPDGRRLVTASKDQTGSGMVRLWDAFSGKPFGEPMKHEGLVGAALFSPDGQRVVVSGTAQLWDVTSGKPIGEPMQHEAVDAEFSPDGQLVVTGSMDGKVRLWASSKPIGEPMKHNGIVYSVDFSPDGQQVVSASQDKTARLWDVVVVTEKDAGEDILLLAELAEAAGGMTLETVGQAENFKLLTPEQVRAVGEKVAAKFSRPPSKLTPLQRFMEWSVSDRKSRTISPFSQLTVSEWLENRIKEGTVEGLRAAMQVDPGNVRITAHLGRHLADQALKQDADPDEARRDRGEADFLTSRALKLAPYSDEVKKLRDEVINLLEVKTN